MDSSTNNLPLVSVLMTAYNREQYIAEAIESVLESTYTNFELIIVDDCSADATVSIAKKYEAADNRITLYLNEKNLGDYANRNQASKYATGKYIMSVDSDDMILKNGMEQCVSCMQDNPLVDWGMYWVYETQAPFILDSKEAINHHFFNKAFLFVGPGGTIMKRSFFEKINRYPVKYGPANDSYFNLKAAIASPVLILPFEFLFYRRHSGQEINNKYSYLINNYLYLKDALEELPLPLNQKQKQWLAKKNKRRFTVNITKYFFISFNISKTRQAISLAGFSFKDAMQGIFH
jgi:glycosyltransferase involved in cell wall biosynthesis